MSNRDPIDPQNDEILPLSRRRRKIAAATAIVMVLVIVGFIVWFTAENATPPDERSGVFGMVVGESAVGPPGLT